MVHFSIVFPLSASLPAVCITFISHGLTQEMLQSRCHPFRWQHSRLTTRRVMQRAHGLQVVRTGRCVMKTSRSHLFKHVLGLLAVMGMVLLPVSSAFASGVAQSELIATTG